MNIYKWQLNHLWSVFSVVTWPNWLLIDYGLKFLFLKSVYDNGSIILTSCWGKHWFLRSLYAMKCPFFIYRFRNLEIPCSISQVLSEGKKAKNILFPVHQSYFLIRSYFFFLTFEILGLVIHSNINLVGKVYQENLYSI